ncbi:hypothetical protein KBD61_05810 [Patescibacteria group bacterium]|nr:hypothetical protein [Patescibacteria group bacterium]MBP9710504.1 hypothetical protein [Patescibacteria group bacterium]
MPTTSVPTSPPVPPTKPTDNAASSHQVTGSLREQLEATYAAIGDSFKEPTPDTYLSLIDAKDKTPDMIQKLQKNWADPEIKQMFKQATFPGLAGTNFVDARQQGDYAAYYFISDPQDTNYLTIEVIRFHQTNNIWQMSQRRNSTSIPIGASAEENRQKTLREIESDPDLGLMPPMGA